MTGIACITARLGRYDAAVEATLQDLDRQHLSERLWRKDPSLWKDDPAIQVNIMQRLGWLSIVSEMQTKAEGMMAFAESVKASGVKTVVLLGMGGSSLCPEVLRKTFGVAEGYPELIVLDTTDPVTIRDAESKIDLPHSLFLLASKSGSTIEMLSLYRYFAVKVEAMTGGEIGAYFMAITDPGSPLEALAREKSFRKIFLAPSDVGGRYAALTYFGLVPAALIGIDLAAFLKRAEERIQNASASLPADKNDAVQLGAMLGRLWMEGCDKLTFITSDSLTHFGIWAEQLVAESTGKEGKGIVPIDGEDIGSPEVYGKDRLFVYLRDASDANEARDAKVDALQNAGHPTVRMALQDPLDLAGQFFLWEMATAVAAVVLGVNPFDEPNVSESKTNTGDVLKVFKTTGKLPLSAAVRVENDIAIAGSVKVDTSNALDEAIPLFLSQLKPKAYLALMVYLPMTERCEACLRLIRERIRTQYHIATTLGYGPRFLHSTGQLHKGGAPIGCFIQITADDAEDMVIPNVGYSFGTLKRAQALGDFQALSQRGMPVLDIRLGRDTEAGLQGLLSVLE
ncbi:MAG: glucose-6-phosphate isomerase [Nitrospiria bacterium]